jgi:hypothetical protein
MTALQEWYATASEKEGALLGMTNKGPTGGPILVVIVFYNGDEEEGRKKFAKLIDLGPAVNGTGMIPYELLNTMQNELVPYGINYHLTGTLRGKKPVESQAAQDIFNQIIQIASAPGDCTSNGDPAISILWEFLHLKKAASVPPDATAFRMRVDTLSLPLLITWEGDSAEATKDAKERLRRVRELVERNLKDTFAGGMSEDDTGYGNYGE